MDIIKFENFKPVVPEGWVNVKIDRQLELRLKSYVKVLDDYLISIGRMNMYQKHDLFLKIDALSDINNDLLSDRTSIQTKLSIVTLLQYLREIRRNFNASTSGFLLEFFIASLIGATVKGDFSKSDLTHKVLDVGKLKYQIKFYDEKNPAEIDWPDDSSKRCDYYIIALKRENSIVVSIFNGKDSNDPCYIEKFAKPLGRSIADRRASMDNSSVIRYKKKTVEKKDKTTGETYKVEEVVKRFIVMDPKEFRIQGNRRVVPDFEYERVINLDKIEKIISSCSESIQNSIKVLFDRISEIEYHAESIITGNINTVEVSKKKTEEITNDIKNQLDGLSDSLINR
jgi:hypothetical protein